MDQITNFTTFVPIALFFTLWIAFPVWFALRRSQGFIRIEKKNQEGEMEQVGMYLELGIFLFAIPFTTFFFFIVFNMILTVFFKDPTLRFNRSLEAAFMLMSIALFIYMYIAERKIYIEALHRKEETDEHRE